MHLTIAFSPEYGQDITGTFEFLQLAFTLKKVECLMYFVSITTRSVACKLIVGTAEAKKRALGKNSWTELDIT